MIKPGTYTHLKLAFQIASDQHQDIHRQWIKISHTIGSNLPNSMLVKSIQDIGNIDIVTRSIEDEIRIITDADSLDVCLYDILNLYSSLWIINSYEAIRNIIRRKLFHSKNLETLHEKLRLVRIPLAKHEIARDNRSKPIELSNKYETRTYDPKDVKKSIIMSQQISSNGSMEWQALNIKEQTSEWIARRNLSELFLSIV